MLFIDIKTSRLLRIISGGKNLPTFLQMTALRCQLAHGYQKLWNHLYETTRTPFRGKGLLLQIHFWYQQLLGIDMVVVVL